MTQLANRNDGVSILSAGAGNSLNSNTIIGNDNNGVLISQTAHHGHDNFIGTDSEGDANLGNDAVGLSISQSDATTVTGNTISGNDADGVVISESTYRPRREHALGQHDRSHAQRHEGSGKYSHGRVAHRFRE